MGTHIFAAFGIILLFKAGATIALTFDLNTATIAENSAEGATVQALAAADGTQPYTYEIVGTSNEFVIDATDLKVKAGATLDFETTPTYTLAITATDTPADVNDTPQTATATLTVSLTDVNEAPVFSEGPYSACVGLNSPADTAVQTVTATDQDADDVITYSLTGGNDDGIYTISSATGALTVATGETVPETPLSYNLEVIATDNDASPLTGTTTVTVTVGNPCPGSSSSVVKDQLYLAFFCVAVAVLKFFSF